jgi:hypothetical protein
MIPAGPFARTASPTKAPKSRVAPALRAGVGGPEFAPARSARSSRRMPAAESDRGDAGGKNQRGKQSRTPWTESSYAAALVFALARIFESPRQPPDAQGRSKRRDRGRQAGGPFVGEMRAKPEPGGPIVERRLLKPRASVKPGRDPISRLGHLSSDPCVARLVRPEQSKRPEVAEQTDPHGEDNCAGGRRGPLALFEGCVQEKESNTLALRLSAARSRPETMALWRNDARLAHNGTRCGSAWNTSPPGLD